jgi:hypothetical protein
MVREPFGVKKSHHSPMTLHRSSLVCAAVFLALISISAAADWPAGFSVPKSTLSPDGRLGVLVPDESHYCDEQPQNKVVEVASGRVLVIIQAETGMEQMNHGGAAPQWSADGSLLLWKVEGKWAPRALVLLKIHEGKVAWQVNILKQAQRATLIRTRKAQPKAYAAARDFNKGNGSAYPEGFTIEVTTPVDHDKPVALPLAVHAELTPDPKGLEDFPKTATLYAKLDAVVTADGKFLVEKFSASH